MTNKMSSFRKLATRVTKALKQLYQEDAIRLDEDIPTELLLNIGPVRKPLNPTPECSPSLALELVALEVTSFFMPRLMRLVYRLRQIVKS